jgi:hypothetical protein
LGIPKAGISTFLHYLAKDPNLTVRRDILKRYRYELDDKKPNNLSHIKIRRKV